MKKGICKLCLEEKLLITKSHIYPEFLYNGVFDNSHRTVYQNFKVGKDKFYQTGFYDKYILCQNCDNVILGSLERYAASFFANSGQNSPVKITQFTERPDFKIVNVTNINYKRFKLFILSLLWRAHISTNPFFKEVNIAAIEPQLRLMLFNQELFEDEDFQISIVRIDRPNGEEINLIPNPQVSLKDTLKVAIFIINGYIYSIELERNSGFSLFPDFSLKNSNEISMPRLSFGAARSFLKALGIPDTHADYYSGTKNSTI